MAKRDDVQVQCLCYTTLQTSSWEVLVVARGKNTKTVAKRGGVVFDTEFVDVLAPRRRYVEKQFGNEATGFLHWKLRGKSVEAKMMGIREMWDAMAEFSRNSDCQTNSGATRPFI